MNRTRRLPLLAPALLALQGCATMSPIPRQALLTDDPPPRGRQCWVSPTPTQLPDASELVDTGAFRAAVSRLWTDEGKPRGYVLLSVRHSPEGTQVRRALIEASVPRELADSMQKLVFAYRREAPPASTEWGVRLRVDMGDPVGLRVGRREECTPRPRDWEYRTAGSPFDVRESSAFGVANPTATDPTLVWVHVRLDSHGSVTDARVERGLARSANTQRLLNYVRSMAFLPAMEDGYPVPGETTIPLRMSVAL
jgi:hypothetical protein